MLFPQGLSHSKLLIWHSVGRLTIEAASFSFGQYCLIPFHSKGDATSRGRGVVEFVVSRECGEVGLR